MNDVKSTTHRYKIIVVLYSINMLNMITYSMCLLHIDQLHYQYYHGNITFIAHVTHASQLIV